MAISSVKNIYILQIKEDINSPFINITHLDEIHVFTNRITAYKYMCDFLDESIRKQRILNSYTDSQDEDRDNSQPSLNRMDYALSEEVDYTIQHGRQDTGPYSLFLTMSMRKPNPRYYSE